MTTSSPSDLPQGSDPPAGALWSSLLEGLPLGVLLADPHGRLIQANAAAEQILSLPREALLSGHLDGFRTRMLAADGALLPAGEAPLARALASGSPAQAGALGWVREDGETRWLEVDARPLADGCVLVSFTDITERHLTGAILAARERIVALAVSASLTDVLRATLDETERLTASRIGFYHFVDADQGTLTLQAWSSRTSQEFCRAEGAGQHYPIAEAGVWAEAVRQRAPVIHNDYAGLPQRKGLPEGHAEVIRELVVPVLQGGRIVALLGVGNKPYGYGSGDIAIVQRLAELAWDVAERKRAEEALRDSEARYRHQFESMRQGAFLQGADGGLLDVNPAALEMLGLTREAFLDRTSLSPAWDVVQEDGSPWPGDQHPSMEALRTGQPVTGRVAGIFNPRRGARVWVEINAVPEFRGRAAVPHQVLVTLHDLTERRQADTVLRASEERFRTLFERMAEGYAHCRMRYDGDLPVDWIYLSVNPAFEELTGIRHATGRWVTELIPGLRDSSPELFETYGRVARVGVPERFEIHLPTLGTWFSVSVFSPGPEEFVATFQNISERKRTEAEVQAARELQQQVLDSLDAHVAVLDPDGAIIGVNEPWRRFAHENGIAETVGTVEQVNYIEAIGRAAADPGSGLDGVCAGIREVLGGLRPFYRTGYPCNTPEAQRWFRMTVLPLRSGQGGAVITHEDITAERNALEALRQAHSQLAMAQRSAGAGMWDWEVQTGRISWSPELFELFGLDPGREEASFEAWKRAIHPDDVQAAGERIEAALAGHTVLSSEYRIVKPDGSHRWIQALGSTAYDITERPERMAGICLDITERKRVELALARSEARNRSMLMTAQDGVWLLDREGRFLEVNDAACRMLAFDRSELLAMRVSDIEALESTEEVRARIERVIRDGSALFESSHRRKDGQVFPVEISTTTLAELGQFVVYIRDITERKRVEAALHDSEARWRTMLEQAGDGFELLDEAGRFVDVNEASCRRSGYTREELLGMTVFDVDPGLDPEYYRANFQRMIGAPPLRSEQVHRRKDGAIVPVEITVSVIRLGGTHYSLAQVRDVSERKRAEADLRRTQEQLSLFMRTSPVYAYIKEVTPSESRVLQASENFVEMVGIPGSQMAGRTMAELFPPDFAAQITADDWAVACGTEVLRKQEFLDGRTYTTIKFPLPAEGRHLLAGYTIDISDQVRAERALQESEAHLKEAQRLARIGHWDQDHRSGRVAWSEALYQVHGLDPAGLAPDWPSFQQRIHPEDRARVAQAFEAHLQDRSPTFTAAYRVVLDSGQVKHLRVHGQTEYDAGGQPVRTFGTDQDVTEQVQAQEALSQSQRTLAAAFRLVPDPLHIADAATGTILEVNDRFVELLGYTREEAIGKCPLQLGLWWDSRERDRYLDLLRIHGEARGFVARFRAGNGRQLHVELASAPITLDGRPCLINTVRDITSEFAAQEALVENEARFRAMFEESPIGMWEEDFSVVRASFDALRAQGHGDLRAYLDGHPEEVARLSGEVRILDINQASVDTLKARDKAQVSRDLPTYFTAASLEVFREELLALAAGGSRFRSEIPCLDSLGQPVIFDFSLAVQPGSEASLQRVLVSFMDITERKRLEDRLRTSEEGLATAQRISMIGSWDWDLASNRVAWSAEMYRLFGLDPAEYDGSPEAVLPVVHPEDRDAFLRNMEANFAEGESGPLDYRVVHADGSVRWLHAHGVVLRDAEGRPVKNLGTVQDITERKRAEAEHRALEEQLQRTQKMESLGSLAGGVAHDMNNVLGAIMALASLHETQALPGTPLRHSMETITKACLRGRTLVQGLLGFARQRLAEERALDLNALVQDQADLLARTTLQRVRLVLDLAPGLRPIQGDPSALSHAVMNLCVNAVDAMPEGGTLTLRTCNQEPAQVGLSVEDTGTGMAPEVLARAVDPFFTTKPQGKGTGLGLSIVYGVVKAHRGRLDLKSTPGEGTCITLCFPACDQMPSAPHAGGVRNDGAGGLRVLVVDDDELVQASMAALLAGLGHRQVTVASGEAALELLQKDPGFHAVILDVNMPGLGGDGTLPVLRARHPALPVLLATGRPSQAVLDLVEATPAVALLAKPFTLEELRAHLDHLPGGGEPPGA